MISGSSSPDYKTLFLKEAALRQQAEERERQAEERERQAEEQERQQRERNQPTTFPEFIRHCHDLLWTPLQAQTLSCSTTGRIPAPIRKYYHNLETYKRLAIKDYIHNIIAKLCKIPEARKEFQLGNGVWFNNHANALDKDDKANTSLPLTTKPSKPDQFCIYQMNSNRNFWQEVVQPNHILMEELEKSRYNTARVVGAAVVQEFHLWVLYNNPTTLYYHLGDPGIYRMAGVAGPGIPRTRVKRTLCLCLMSFSAPLHNQAWRKAAKKDLPEWHLILDSDCSHILTVELLWNPTMDNASSEFAMTTRARAGCAPSSGLSHHGSPLDSEADLTVSAGQKRGFSQVTLSLPTQRSAPRADSHGNQSRQSRSHDAPYCIQICLLGLQQGGALDPKCPNKKLHMLGGTEDRHPISTADLVKKLQVQLDQDLDHNCTPIGPCGSSGAPFKITCATFGYTVVGKGTTSRLWGEVSRETKVYQVLQRAQASAVPVFLGTINLAQTYFLYSAGRICHMLLMGWGGKSMGHNNILWNAKLERALIINFYLCTLDC
ncbi:uncharacterized protein BJX67DRAFT_387425 [Aspergillus lucknowensis]|uniref:Uncharacterized protein n=1 Tax=Aspergillus lucknowensis TaxID=176173 RepID=A0ABR4LV17_9EURO